MHPPWASCLIVTPIHDDSSPNPSSAADAADPFARDSRDEALFVADVPPSHSLLLNKYRSLDQHVRALHGNATLHSKEKPCCFRCTSAGADRALSLPAFLPLSHTLSISHFHNSHAHGHTHPCMCVSPSLLFVLICGIIFDSMCRFRLCSWPVSGKRTPRPSQAMTWMPGRGPWTAHPQWDSTTLTELLEPRRRTSTCSSCPWRPSLSWGALTPNMLVLCHAPLLCYWGILTVSSFLWGVPSMIPPFLIWLFRKWFPPSRSYDRPYQWTSMWCPASYPGNGRLTCLHHGRHPVTHPLPLPLPTPPTQLIS